MGVKDKYDIRWNNFESRMSHSFAEIRNQEQFLDVTLAAEAADGTIEALQAHKVILSACSPILRDMLLKQSALTPHSIFMPVMLYLKGISAKDLAHILEFIYKGSVKLKQDELDDFLQVAKILQIPLDQENNQKTPSIPSIRSSWSIPTKRSAIPPSSGGGGKQQIKRKKVMLGPKSEPIANDRNQEVATPPMVKTEPSMGPLGYDLEEDLVAFEEEDKDMTDEAFKHNDSDDLGVRISAGAAVIKDTFINENVTETEEGFECKPCGKLIKHRSSLNRHVEGKHVNLGVKYQCPHCTSVARTKNSLGVHVHNYHPEMKGQGLNYDQCAIYEDCY